MSLYDNIKLLCDEKGIKPATMCRELGLSLNLPTELKTGRKKTVKAETAAKIADYFGISVNELLTGKKENVPAGSENVVDLLSSLRDDTRALLEVLPNMTVDQVRQMTDFAKFLRSQNER